MAQILPQPDMNYKPHDPREQDIEYPETPETIARAQAATRQERIDNGLDPDTGMPLDDTPSTFNALVTELKRFESQTPGTVIEFIKRPEHQEVVDELPPAKLAEWDVLQLRESNQQAAVADMLARTIYRKSLSQLDRREKCTLRALACHALRLAQDHWKREAEARARAAGVHALKTECGAAFRHISQKQAEAIANVMWMHQRAAYTRITEGTEHLSPSEYLRIVRGEHG